MKASMQSCEEHVSIEITGETNDKYKAETLGIKPECMTLSI